MKAKFAPLFAAVLVMITRQADAAMGKPTIAASPSATVDVGVEITFTCTAGAGDAPTSFEFFLDASSTAITAGVTSPTYKRTTVIGDNTKAITCKGKILLVLSAASDPSTMAVTAIPAPTLTSLPAATTTGTISTTILLGDTVKFTCAKLGTAKQDPVKYTFLNGATAVATGVSGAVWTYAAVVVADNNNDVTCEHWNSATLKTASTAIKIIVTLTPSAPTVTGIVAEPKEKDSMSLICVKTTTTGVDDPTTFEWYNTTGNAAGVKVVSAGTLMANYTFTVSKAHKDNTFRCKGKNTLGLGVFSAEQKITDVKGVATTQVISLLTLCLALAVSATLRD